MSFNLIFKNKMNSSVGEDIYLSVPRIIDQCVENSLTNFVQLFFSLDQLFGECLLHARALWLSERVMGREERSNVCMCLA